MNLSLKIKNLVLIKLIIFGIVCLTSTKISAQTNNQQENCYKPAADRPELYLKLLKIKYCRSCQTKPVYWQTKRIW